MDTIDFKNRDIDIQTRLDGIADFVIGLQATVAALPVASVSTSTDDDTKVEAEVATLEKEVGTDTPTVDATVTADQVATDTTAA